ncbi:hypothetical protein [Burkholderia cenocepacia]|uniref:hypothetical protein n=1 Tax=Burkholderia cenocepacia TaxID=95486 RepID=UPI00097C4D8E|nr:hypothetical protein [Burkholderia cenocepacia]AQQ23077.1 hypothetical protein A8D61_17985 [Burkholderia cenocepacia]ONJ20847.1 hypothetical protein A8D82_13920 [Burkholderia cenocepacia]ONN96197.1 hypothetical protein A8D64_00290 [Burkholderia cenocepacia]ONO00564.1 hypothetical protein A8D62_00005 [Burkholderia cenocepacia]ONO00573.1 hypothetical protein A8D62_00425 [Burkholderia cenocepacia]
MHPNNHRVGNVRTLSSRTDALADRQQAAADDAAIARDERNEAIADGVTFDLLPFSAEQIAVLDAALRRGYIEDVYEVWNLCKDVLAAEIKRRIADADLASAAPHFANVYCSGCGQKFGPGNAGFSSCTDHAVRRALDD